MVINNTRPEYGLHHGHNIVLVTVPEVSAENLAMTSTDGVAQTDAINVIVSLALQPYKERPRRSPVHTASRGVNSVFLRNGRYTAHVGLWLRPSTDFSCTDPRQRRQVPCCP
jgi:hypothetical protein